MGFLEVTAAIVIARLVMDDRETTEKRSDNG